MSESRHRMGVSLSRAESAAIGRRRRGRNLAMLAVLVALCGLFYLITLVKLTQHGP